MQLHATRNFLALITIGAISSIPACAQEPAPDLQAPAQPTNPVESAKVVELGPNSKLIYYPYTAQGDTILNFSNCGYGGGGVKLPNVAVKMTLSPVADSKDDLPRLQRAVDALAKMPLDAHGFRGALLLKRGVYRLSDAIKVTTSGIVIRGEGSDEQGTMLLGISRKKYNLVSFAGGPIQPLPTTAQKITSDYVPVGTRSFSVADGSGFKPGDTVLVTRHSNAAWIHEIKMDRIKVRDKSTRQWGPFDLVFDRVVTQIAENSITLDAPLGNSIDQQWGGGSIAKYDDRARIQNVGIENLFGICEFDRSIKKTYKDKTTLADDNHVNRLVGFDNAQNVWARDLGARYLQGVVSMGRGVKYATVQDSYSIEPVSLLTGGHRYPFFSNGQLTLWQRCRADESRHAFVYDSRICGPNVFLDCTATNENGSSEAHHRWSVGGLYDNVHGNVAVNDRGNQGTGQGWGGANYVVWNGEGTLMLQSPPTAQNFAIGYVGQVKKPTFGETNGWFVSYGGHVQPRSLYLQQLEERVGPQAVQNIAPGQ